MTAARRLTAVLVLLLTAALHPAVAHAAGGPRAERVWVVGVPGLAWDDVGPATPALRDLAAAGSAGALSVRDARSRTCLLDGWLTLGAGNRVAAADPGPPPTDPALSHCGLQERTAAAAGAGADPAAALTAAAGTPGSRSFGAEPGALGRAVGCAAVAGRTAALAAAASGVRLTAAPGLPADPAGLRALLTGCPLALISLDQLTDAGTHGAAATATGTDPRRRAPALAQVDAAVARLRAAAAALPGRTLLLLAGVAEVGDGEPRLHVGVAAGPGFPAGGWLTSASTGRAPYVQLIDLAPTALRALGRPVPASMTGQPLQPTGVRPAPAAAVARLAADSTAATVHHRSAGVLFVALPVLAAALLAAAALALGGVPGRRRRDPGRAGPPLRLAALAVAALPVATYLAGLVPWERAGAPRAALLAAVLGADLAVTAVAATGPWRRRPLCPPAAVLAVTLGTLVADVLTGSTLERDGLLGYDAVVAGRFTGWGNLSSGLLLGCGLPLVAAAAAAAGRRSARPARTAGAVALLLGAGLVALDAAPGLGRDLGGTLAAVPGVLVLAMLLGGVRVTAGRLVAVLAAAGAVVTAVAVLDRLRPPAVRTHLGRFVQQVQDGGAGTVVARKTAANLHVLIGSPLPLLLVLAALAAAWLVRPGGLLRGGALPAAGPAALRPGLTAAALALAVGAAVNDSGVAVPATAAAVLVPLAVWLAAAPEEVRPALPERAEEARRVTVGSRGSTVENA